MRGSISDLRSATACSQRPATAAQSYNTAAPSGAVGIGASWQQTPFAMGTPFKRSAPGPEVTLAHSMTRMLGRNWPHNDAVDGQERGAISRRHAVQLPTPNIDDDTLRQSPEHRTGIDLGGEPPFTSRTHVAKGPRAAVLWYRAWRVNSTKRASLSLVDPLVIWAVRERTSGRGGEHCSA